VRIPFPERVSYLTALIAATLLMLVQQLEHTDKLFSLLCFVYVIITVLAFNVAGGMYRPAGAYIGFTALLNALIGLAAKGFLGEPANSNLQAPVTTMLVYVGGMSALLAAVLVERSIRPTRPLVERWFPTISLRSVYLGAAVMGITSNAIWITSPKIGNFAHFLHNVDVLLPFSLILGVIYTVRSSDGKHSVTPFLLGLMVLQTLDGVAQFSKQGLLTPAFCWALGAGIARYRMKLVSGVLILISGFMLLHYGLPIVQVGKDIEHGNDQVVNFQKVRDLFLHFDQTKAEYEASNDEEESPVLYYNHPQGFLDRLSFLSTDDLLIQESDQDGQIGYLPVIEGFENLVPHFLWADKPTPYFGNLYAHDLGLLPDDDMSTGVSFGAAADAYKEGGFVGVLVMMPLLFTVIFCSISLVVGDVRNHPAAILLVLAVAHVGPEGMLPGAILLLQYLAVVVGFGFMARYVFPLVAAAALPPPQTRPGEFAVAVD
jgi:hypothetical protein